MWISSIATPLLALCFLLDLSACLRNTHLRATNRIERPLPLEGILQDHASLHATRLAIRSQNLTEGRLVVKDLTFLIPSEQHLALLYSIYNDIHTTATNALNLCPGCWANDKDRIPLRSVHPHGRLSLQTVRGWVPALVDDHYH